MNRIAVVLFNLGGPDSLDAVQPFLENLFNDPDIFRLPFQKALARFISKKRAPKVVKEYELIGGKSPLGYWTEKQRLMLEQRIRQVYPECDVFTAMRYWHPLTAEAVLNVAKKSYQRVILLPLYPHFSISTTGSSYNEWIRHYKGDRAILSLVKSYQTHPAYIKALNSKIDEGLMLFPADERPLVNLVFSAHGTPVSYVKKGDPYSLQIRETIEAVMRLRDNSHPYHLCFQSKVGPAKWLQPYTDEKIAELAQQGRKHLLIIPVSFASDHVETLFELGIEYKHTADKCGIERYIVMPGLNDSPEFVQALYELIIKNLEQGNEPNN